MGVDRPGILLRVVRQVFGGVAARHLEVRFLREERDVCDRVHLAFGDAGRVEHLLGEDVVHLEGGKIAEQVARQLVTRAPVAGMADAGHHVEQGVEAVALGRAGKIALGEPKITAVFPQQADEVVEGPVLPLGRGLLDRFEAFVEDRLGRARVAAPEQRVVYDDVHGLVVASHFLDVQFDVLDRGHGVHPLQQGSDRGNQFRHLQEPLHRRPDAVAHDLGDADPARVVPHLGRGVELEHLALHVEVQPREGLLVTIEELRRLTANEASLLRLASAILSEISDDWETERAYLTMEAR